MRRSRPAVAWLTTPATGLVAGLLACLPVDPASGQPPGDAAKLADPSRPADAAALLRDMDRAMRESPLRFTVSRSVVGSLAGVQNTASAEFVVAPAADDDPVGWMFRIDGVEQRPDGTDHAFLLSYDGALARRLDRDARELVESVPAGAAGLFDGGAEAVSAWLLRWDMLVRSPFAAGAGDLPAEVVGRTTADGVACDIVSVDLTAVSSIDEYQCWWTIGAEDHLPRRLDFLYIDFDGRGTGFSVLTLTGVSRVESPQPFTIEAPAGFAVRRQEPARRDLPVAAGGRTLVGQLAPDFTLTDSAGNPWTLSSRRGRVVVLDFWATWCVPCQLAMPGLQRIHDRFGSAGVEVVGVNCWESSDAAAYMKKHGFSYTLLPEGDAVAQAMGVAALPTLIIVGPDGRIAHHSVGFEGDLEAALTAVIESLLKDTDR